jgi:hypothetical protein
MVPGEENQLVPKEVRGRRGRLGPRPAVARSLEATQAGPGPVGPGRAGRRGEGGGGVRTGVRRRRARRAVGPHWVSAPLPLGAGTPAPRGVRIKEHSGAGFGVAVVVCAGGASLNASGRDRSFHRKHRGTAADGHGGVTVLLVALTVAVCSFQGL